MYLPALKHVFPLQVSKCKVSGELGLHYSPSSFKSLKFAAKFKRLLKKKEKKN